MNFEMRLVLVVGLAALLAGCATTKTQEQATKHLQENAGGVVVIGVKATLRFTGLINELTSKGVSIGPLQDDGASVTRSFWEIGHLATVNSGYAVVLLPASKDAESYGFESFQGGIAHSMPIFCRGSTMPVFRVGAGEVLYLGNYELTQVSQHYSTTYRWTVRMNDAFDEAKQAIEKTHPEVASKLKRGSVVYRKVDFGSPCVK